MSTLKEQYTHTILYQIISGVQAVCSDCHVPKPRGAKLIPKIKASNEIYREFMDTIETPEKQ